MFDREETKNKQKKTRSGAKEIQISEVKRKESYLNLKRSDGPQDALVPLTLHRVMSGGSPGPTPTPHLPSSLPPHCGAPVRLAARQHSGPRSFCALPHAKSASGSAAFFFFRGVKKKKRTQSILLPSPAHSELILINMVIGDRKTELNVVRMMEPEELVHARLNSSGDVKLDFVSFI